MGRPKKTFASFNSLILLGFNVIRSLIPDSNFCFVSSLLSRIDTSKESFINETNKLVEGYQVQVDNFLK